MRIDVDEDRPRSGAHDRAGGGEKAEGSRDDGVAGLDAAAERGEPQGVRPGSAADGVSVSAEGGDFTLERLHLFAQNEMLRRADALDRGENLFADRGVLPAEIEHGHAGQDARRSWNAAVHGWQNFQQA